MTERGEPRLGVVLAAFLGVCGLADVSPLFKLHPPSAILGLLVGEGEGTRATVLYALLVGVAVAVPALALWLVARSRALPDGRGALFANVSIVLLLFAVAQIMATRASSLHALGRGSNQGDCIVMPARALASGHWPYDRALIWSGNACSPGLGWVALALPLVLVTGYASFLVAGGAAFAALPERMLGRRTVTAFLLLTVSCVTSWQSLATGADDLAIGIGFALVTLLSARPRLTILAAIAAGLLATARLPFAFFPSRLRRFSSSMASESGECSSAPSPLGRSGSRTACRSRSTHALTWTTGPCMSWGRRCGSSEGGSGNLRGVRRGLGRLCGVEPAASARSPRAPVRRRNAHLALRRRPRARRISSGAHGLPPRSGLLKGCRGGRGAIGFLPRSLATRWFSRWRVALTPGRRPRCR